MNKQTILSMIMLGIALVGFTYGAVAKNESADAKTYLELELRNNELENEIAQLKQQRWDFEDMKNECVESYAEQQEKISKEADKKRQEQGNNTFKQMGLLKRSQPQKKINDSTEGESGTIDSAEMIQDNGWFKRLMKSVGLI